MTLRPILVVAATARELAPAAGWDTLLCGVGPVDAAAITARRLAADPPWAVLHVGIGGARLASGLAPGTVVIGGSSYYTDLDVPSHFAPRELAPAEALVAALRAAFPEAPVLPIATTGRVGGILGGNGAGSAHCAVEAMEGFAVLRAAALAGIPAVELRVISNTIEETDRRRWALALAFDTVTALQPRAVEALRRA